MYRGKLESVRRVLSFESGMESSRPSVALAGTTLLSTDKASLAIIHLYNENPEILFQGL